MADRQARFERAVAVLGRNHAWLADNYRVAVAEARLYRAAGNETLWRPAADRARQAVGERVPSPEILRFDAEPTVRGTRADLGFDAGHACRACRSTDSRAAPASARQPES